jgi:DNA-binding sugar fermentation-stimulating protein
MAARLLTYCVYPASCSATIRSPYVADVRLEDGSVCMAHAPGMELGGICVAGARLLLSRPAKAGTTKTAFSIQLVAADAPQAGREACWVGAYPLLGNRLVAAALKRGLLVSSLGAHSAVRAEATHGAMRVDFQLTHDAVASAGSAHITTLLEVKNVVCSDFPPLSTAPKPKGYDLVYGEAAVPGGYARAAIFPVGKRGQKLEDGTPVVSTRAIKHVRELAQLAAESGGTTKARARSGMDAAQPHACKASPAAAAATGLHACLC